MPQQIDRRCAPRQCWDPAALQGVCRVSKKEALQAAASVCMLLALPPGLLVAMGRRKVWLGCGVSPGRHWLMGTHVHKIAVCLPQGKRTLARDFRGKSGEPARYQEKRQRASNGVWHEPKLDNASYEEYYKTQVLVVNFLLATG